MEKTSFEEFEDCIKNFEGSTVLLSINTMINTKIEITNLSVSIENFMLILNSGKENETKIDLNYIANFYKAQSELKLELDSIGYILIRKK